MILKNGCSKQTVNFQVYIEGDKGVPAFNADIAPNNNHQIPLNDNNKWDVYTKPLSVCPTNQVKSGKLQKGQDVTTYDNWHHDSGSSLFVAIT